MKLLGRPQLDRLHGDNRTETWVRSWVSELKTAQWKCAADVQGQFPNVRHHAEREFEFPVAGQRGKNILVEIIFPQGVAVITEVKA